MNETVEMLIPAVEQQLESGETVYVKETFTRLVADPEIDELQAKQMIALCLADETERMMEDEREFDAERYRTLLDLLPTLPE